MKEILKERDGDMYRESIINLIMKLTEGTTNTDDGKLYIEEEIINPMGESMYYRYDVMDEEHILISKRINNEQISKSFELTFRQLIWNKFGLKKVCEVYWEYYKKWEHENGNDIPYIETNVIDDANGNSMRTMEFIYYVWKSAKEIGDKKNLKMLLAEYGIGKTSFCQGVRRLVAEKICTPFLEGQIPFVFVFDLNEFESGNFERFIENELSRKYKILMEYSLFEEFCQSGIFMVVLDAWDQMKNAKELDRGKYDINNMSGLWKKDGQVLITCRRSFYQQQLKNKGGLNQNVWLYTLMGFDMESAIEYLEKDSDRRKICGETILISNIREWIERRWKINDELLGKPLNLKLLVSHFDEITRLTKLHSEKVNTYRFLEIVFEDWIKRNEIRDTVFLKKLVIQTLEYGLNRSIAINSYKDRIDEKEWDKSLEKIRQFDFIKVDDTKNKIEFYLAAYQEFLWAYFVLEELRRDPSELDNADTLLRNYLLIREVREWICLIFGGIEDNQLKKQIQSVYLRKREEVGYRGSNALTLLCDLNSIPYYKKQLDDIKRNLAVRPLMGTDFRGIDLSDADFHNTDLEGADFSFSVLKRVDFTCANLAQTIWREHEWLTKCAFLYQGSSLCVAAGTSNGGVLTYRTNNNSHAIVDLQNDIINDLSGDRGGIYTASSDGWVGYINDNGDLKNAYIAQSGLQSIAYSDRSSNVYVGADNHGIYRYNWQTGSKQKIEITPPLGHQNDRISDIHYYSNGVDEYIAYTLNEKKLLVLVKLTGLYGGKVEAKCILNSGQYHFDSICFAGKMLIYSIIPKGVFFLQVSEMFGDILEDELLMNQQLLLQESAKEFLLGWADKPKSLFMIAKHEGVPCENLYMISLDDGGVRRIDLDWTYEGEYLLSNFEQFGGFSVSDTGEFLAISGDSLAIFREMGGYYSLLRSPIEAKILCDDAKFTACTGLTNRRRKFFVERGGKDLPK